MNRFELILQELGELSDVEMKPASDGIAEVVVRERAVLMRMVDETDSAIMLFTTVADEADDAMKARALELSLFGKGVVGRHLGLFADALILSGNLVVDGLTAEAFAKEVIAFASLADDLSRRLCSVAEDEAKALGHKGQITDDVYDMHLHV